MHFTGAINSYSLHALPEYVEVSDESHVYITPSTAISVGQSVISAQLHMRRKAARKKAGDFWLLSGEIIAQLLKKVYLK